MVIVLNLLPYLLIMVLGLVLFNALFFLQLFTLRWFFTKNPTIRELEDLDETEYLKALCRQQKELEARQSEFDDNIFKAVRQTYANPW